MLLKDSTTDIFKIDDRRLDKIISQDEGMHHNDYRVFSASDMVAQCSLPDSTTYRLGTIALLSVSTHRDKFPVVTFGHVNPRGFTSGPRTIGGSLIFQTMDRSVWANLMQWRTDNKTRRFPQDISRGYPDDLPPFDIHISFVNEYGHVATKSILGITILDEAETWSLEDLQPNASYSYLALSNTPLQALTAINEAKLNSNKSKFCTYSVNPGEFHFSISGGEGTIRVTTTAECPWSARSLESWMTLTRISSYGSGSVSFTVAVNSGSERVGYIEIAGRRVKVTQDGVGDSEEDTCAYSIDPTEEDVPYTGGSGTVSVTTGVDCEWTAISNHSSWLHVTGGSSGTGLGTVSWTADANSGPPRDGTITIGGEIFTVHQDAPPSACELSIDPSSRNFSQAGGSGDFDVAMSGGCGWDVSSDYVWITIGTVTGDSPGNPTGNVEYTVASNPGPPRTGTIIVDGDDNIAQAIHTVIQDGGAPFICPDGSTPTWVEESQLWICPPVGFGD
jgi:hypothetical protein